MTPEEFERRKADYQEIQSQMQEIANRLETSAKSLSEAQEEYAEIISTAQQRAAKGLELELTAREKNKLKIEQENIALKARAESLKQNYLELQRQEDALRSYIVTAQASGDLDAEQISILEQQADAYRRLADQIKVSRDQAIQEALDKEVSLDKSKKIKEATDNLAQSLAGAMGITESWRKTIVGSFIQAGISAEDLDDVMKDLGESMAKAFRPANLLGSSIEKIAESSLKFGKFSGL